MKAILEFNLPEDSVEHLQAVNNNLAWSALEEIRTHIRNHEKYENVLNLEFIKDKIQTATRAINNGLI